MDDKKNVVLGGGHGLIDQVGAEAKIVDAQVRKMTLPQDSAARKEIPIYSGVIRYFPAALAEVAKISKIGNDKHNPGKPLQHSRGLSGDHLDCMVRHMIDCEENGGLEPGTGAVQLAYNAWRALAELQEWLEENKGAPPAPAASFPDPE